MRIPTTLWLVLISAHSGIAAQEKPEPTVPPADRAPEWIWANDDRHGRRNVVFSYAFDAPAAFSEARLRLFADFAGCSVSLNGQSVVAVDDFGPHLDLDITNFLRRHKNTIRVRAQGSDGPSALAMSLQITTDGAAMKSIVTDSSWLVHVDDAATSETPRHNVAWSAAVSFGEVAARMWTDPRHSRITAFDDYTQWKLASGDQTTAAEIRVSAPPGFEVELLRTARPEDGSWISMAFDSQGRLTISKEDKGLLRLTLATNGNPESLETLNDTLLECRGLLYAHGGLYANANNSKGLYRLRDSNGDDQLDEVKLLREFPGGVGHGRNDLAIGPDGLIYSIHGDAVNLPQTNVDDRTSPFRDGRLEKPQKQGHVMRTDRNGERWELVAAGLRNPYGIDFNEDGELFTYDADAEFDMGAPWYRPTRLDHLVSGADFGWRGLTNQWPPYELDHADNALPTATIGKGSPTAVRFGRGSRFPAPWKDALFILDWAYGRVVACHLYPRGAGYVGRSASFLKGRPLNVTDVDFGPDGAMYLITGGRKTESSLYRVQWTGEPTASQKATLHQDARIAFSSQQRELRRQLERWHSRSDDGDAVDEIWPHLSSPDPVIRHAARVALEHQDIDHWRDRALRETHASTAAVSLLALARGMVATDYSAIITAANNLSTDRISVFDTLCMLHAYSLCLADTTHVPAAVLSRTRTHLKRWLSKEAVLQFQRIGPLGTGHGIPAKLGRMVKLLEGTVANADVIQLLRTSTSQENQMRYLFLLHDTRTGWQHDDRVLFFETLDGLERNAIGGDGMPGFLQRIRQAAVNSLSEVERIGLGDLIERHDDKNESTATIERPHVRDWSVADIDELLDAAQQHNVDTERASQLFAEAQCGRCHRVHHRGGVTGPDLTSVGNRFSRRDILKSILAPSDVVAEKYRNIQIVTTAGQTIVGRVVSSGDYRSPTLRISTDPLAPSKMIEVSKSEIDTHQYSKVSPMPKGLLSTFTAGEIVALLDYLAAASGRIGTTGR
ncbi:MAG: PQQ-dependent sugar dehydrogenase [Fuerstiella sp.]